MCKYTRYSICLFMLAVLYAGAPLRAQDKKDSTRQATAPATSGRVEVERIPEVLVVGSRVLNTDIRRTEDDAQPYVVFDGEELRQSGVTDLGEFLRQRLTMNSSAFSGSQAGGPIGNVSEINLRGLGANQTLILVDGHRRASTIFNGTPDQPNINGIPFSAIERIEILPTTASGIHGGSATGGVINVILRRDYRGTELTAKYDNTFDTDSGVSEFSLTSAFELGSGTQVMIAANYSASNELLQGDRDIFRRHRAAILATNPGFYLNATSPPLGATTNIRSVNGSPLFGAGTPNFTTLPPGYTASMGLAPLQANAGQYNFDLAPSAQLAGRYLGLLSSDTNRSALASIRRDIGERLTLFVEGSASRRESDRFGSVVAQNTTYTIAANAPNNPFGQAIRVNAPISALDRPREATTEDSQLLAGVILRLPGQWSAEADYNVSKFRAEFEQSPTLSGAEAAAISNGTLNVLRDPELYAEGFRPFIVPARSNSPQHTKSENAVLRAAGPVARLWGGPLTLAATAGELRETLDEASFALNTGAVTVFPGKSQAIDSLYVEATLPLVSAANDVVGVRDLELQLAGRYDRYVTNGVRASVPLAELPTAPRETNRVSSANPTVGLRYEPVNGLMVRASWGTGFLAPSVQQLIANPPAAPTSFATARDPQRGNESLGTIPFSGGGNPDLEPEESESISAGVVAQPLFAPGLRVSVDYTRIKKTNTIASPLTYALNFFGSFEAAFPERVTRGTPPPGDPFPVGPVTALDLRLANLSTTDTSALDVAVDYQFEFEGWGVLDFYAMGTRTLDFETRLAPELAAVSNLGLNFANITGFKANAGLDWRYGGLTLGWTSRYVDSYTVSSNPNVRLNQGSDTVPAQMFHDVHGRYRFSDTWPAMAGLEVMLGMRNVLDKEPVLDAQETSRLYSPHGDVRGRSYYVMLRKEL